MHITYDPEHNIGYIRLKETQGKVARTLSISEDMNIDMAADGSIYGIELLNANEQLKGKESAIIIDQHNHQRRELPL
jgi:uncharacterized protein YuzE